MNIPHYLVVGVNGTIGHALFEKLRQNGCQAWGTTQCLNAVKPGLVSYLNLLDGPQFWQLPNLKFDVVYLCAGISGMAICEEDPLGSRKVNVNGMSRLAQYLSQQDSFIVYLSTNQVFSGQVYYVRENAPYQPLNEYGRQKVIMEKFIKEECKRWAIVRLTKVIEPHMSLIQYWIDRLRRKECIEVFFDMVLAPVSLRHVVDILVQLGQKKEPGYYAISGDRDLSYHEVANYIAEKLSVSFDRVKPVSALSYGIKKRFLPRFTTMFSSSTTALCGQEPPHILDVLQECFNLCE